MVTHIDGRPLNSGHKKLKAINRIYPAYVNQKGAPYVNARNKPIISKIKPITKYTFSVFDEPAIKVALDTTGDFYELTLNKPVTVTDPTAIYGYCNLVVDNGTPVVEAYLNKADSKTSNLFDGNKIVLPNEDYDTLELIFEDGDTITLNYTKAINSRVTDLGCTIELVSDKKHYLYISGYTQNRLTTQAVIESNIPRKLPYNYTVHNSPGFVVNGQITEYIGDPIDVGDKIIMTIPIKSNYIVTYKNITSDTQKVTIDDTSDPNNIFIITEIVDKVKDYSEGRIDILVKDGEVKKIINILALGGEDTQIDITGVSLDSKTLNIGEVIYDPLNNAIIRCDGADNFEFNKITVSPLYSTNVINKIYDSEDRIIVDMKPSYGSPISSLIEIHKGSVFNKYTGSFVASEIAGLDNIYYKLTTDKGEINKTSTDHSEFKFNTLSIEGFVKDNTTSGGIVLKLNNGTPIKAVTSTSGAQYTMQQDDDGNNIIFGLSMDRSADTIQVTFEDDDVLEIPITWAVKASTYTISAVNDPALPYRDEIIYSISDRITYHPLDGNNETPIIINDIDAIRFKVSTDNKPQIKLKVLHNVFKITNAVLASNKNVILNTEESTIQFEFDPFLSDILELTFEDGNTISIRCNYEPKDGYAINCDIKINNISEPDNLLSLEGHLLNGTFTTILDSVPLNIEYNESVLAGLLSIDYFTTSKDLTLVITNDGSKVQWVDSYIGRATTNDAVIVEDDTDKTITLKQNSIEDIRTFRIKFENGNAILVQVSIANG